MNGGNACENITDLTYQNSETTTIEQAIFGSGTEVDPHFTGGLVNQKNHGLKRKQCEISADTELEEKKCRFKGDDENVTASETKERQYDSLHVPSKLSDTLKASFVDESEITNFNAKFDNEAKCSLQEEGKRGRRRKRGQRKNKANEKLLETEKALLQTNMCSILVENDAQKTLTSQEVGNNVTKTEKCMSTFSSVASKPFSKLTEKPKSKADEVVCKSSFSKPKAQETINLNETPKHTEKQQLNNKKVASDSFPLKIQSEETKSKPVPSLSKPKRNEQIFIYGNYSRYYGYRSPELEEDARLSCFPQSFFEGKEVLDIGCNIGHATLLIARDWRPKRIVGLDIDGKLINIAKKNVKHYLGKSGQKKLHSSSVNSLGGEAALNNNSLKSTVKPGDLFPSNVMFMQGNYVLERDDLVALQKEEYDVILALSISKWIHLNFGDEGLKRTFQRVFRQLRPDGKFILEPQEWSSYKKKKKLTETIFENFKNIKFRPDSFRNYLLSDDVGFSSCALLGIPNNKSKGFRRPLLMFSKSSSENSTGSLGETEQQHSATNEDHSTLTCSVDSTKMENAIVNSGEEKSLNFRYFSEGVTHVQDNTENGGTALNVTDTVTINDATCEDHSALTCVTDPTKTENASINSDEVLSPSLKDFSEVVTHIQDNTKTSATALNMALTPAPNVATNEDHSMLTCSTDSTKTENAIIIHGNDLM